MSSSLPHGPQPGVTGSVSLLSLVVTSDKLPPAEYAQPWEALEIRERYSRGIGTSYAKSLEIQQRAVDQGDERADFSLGCKYENGVGVTKNLEKGFQFYERASDAGNIPATTSLGYMYENGLGVSRNSAKAAELYKKVAECDGDMFAVARLSSIHEKALARDGAFATATEKIRAYEYILREEEDAIRILTRNLRTMSKNSTKAFGRSRAIAMERGRPNSERCNSAAWSLAEIYLKGGEEIQNRVKALRLFKRTANAAAGYMHGVRIWGERYENGRGGCPADYLLSCDLYRIAADAGDMKAAHHMGRMYEFGNGVSKDYDQSCKFYQRAADAGNTEAAVHLGRMYLYGFGVSVDFAKAFALFQRAVDAGDLPAMALLGYMYANGLGVAKGSVLACQFFQRFKFREGIRALPVRS